MIPEAFRRSQTHRKLFATMEFLSERDPAGPISKGEVDREVVKRAVDRRRTLLEHRMADEFRAYFREERAHVVRALVEERGFDIDGVIESLEPDLRETYESAWSKAAKSWGAWAASHVGKSLGRVSKAGDLDDRVDGWLRRNLGKKITGITEASRKKIAAQIAQGTEAGETIAQIAGRIDKFYLEDVIPNRSMVIARTEVGTAVNWAQHVAATDAADEGVEMEKEWLALRDDRTRDDHADADGQVVGLDEPFQVGGEELMYPGDPSGSPEEIINCRCSVLHRVVGDEGRAKSSQPGAPTVDEFARQVVNVEGADVATALAFARGVFGERDDWVTARRALMKRVYHLRRAVDVEKYSPDQPRDEGGRWTDTGAGLSRTPENARRAEEAREHRNGAVLRYLGGSRAAINPGEHVTVRGVYGMSDKTGVVYYNVEAANGRRFTLAGTTLRPPREGEVAAAPADPRPLAPRAPRVEPRPAPGQEEAPLLGDSPYLRDKTSGEVSERLRERTGVPADLKHLDVGAARLSAGEFDRLSEKYGRVTESMRLQGKTFSAGPEDSRGKRWGVTMAESGKFGIRLNSTFFNRGNGQSVLSHMEQTVWHPRGCALLEDHVSHEFGHQLYTRLYRTDYERFHRFMVIRERQLASVSRYAKTSSHEAFAEAFAELESRESGRSRLPLSEGAEALRDYLSDSRARGVL